MFSTPTDTTKERPLPPKRALPADEPGMTYEQLLGSCEKLWDTEEEFEDFLAVIETTRKAKD